VADEKGSGVIESIRTGAQLFAGLPLWAQIFLGAILVQLCVLGIIVANYSKQQRTDESKDAASKIGSNSSKVKLKAQTGNSSADWKILGVGDQVKPGKLVIRSMRVEVRYKSRLSSEISHNAESSLVSPIIQAPAYLREDQGAGREVMLEAKTEKRWYATTGETAEIINWFELPQDSVIAGSDYEELGKFVLLDVPIGRAVNGNEFDELMTMEIRITVNGKMVWRVGRDFEIAFPSGSALRLSIGNILELPDMQKRRDSGKGGEPNP
jgi:hypothetical protein